MGIKHTGETKQAFFLQLTINLLAVKSMLRFNCLCGELLQLDVKWKVKSFIVFFCVVLCIFLSLGETCIHFMLLCGKGDAHGANRVKYSM